jgi:pimeloyl-ACP methyl ester carboxylesterase
LTKTVEKGEVFVNGHWMKWSAVAAALIAAVAPVPSARAERAASIDYEVVERPASLPPTFQAPDGMTLRFLAIKAIDGYRVDAALWQPSGKAASDTTAIVSVHGSGGSYSKVPVVWLSPAMATRGYAVLAINTRQHDEHVNTDNFVEIRRDIEAAVHTLRALGYRSIVLHGHSLGNVQVLFYAATAWDPDIKALYLTSMFGNLPWKSRHMLIQNEENYRALTEASFKALRDEKPGEVLPVLMHSYTGRNVPTTAQHFFSYRLENSGTADGTYWIRRVPRPILMVRDASDSIVASFEPYMLLSAAQSAGSLVPNVKLVVLPNTKPASPAAHFFTDTKQPLVDSIASWLAEQKL